MTLQLRQTAAALIETADVAIVPETAPVVGGIARGTIILTARGEMAVEDLQAGDRIITRERGMSVLKSVDTATRAACSVRADSLGIGRPDRDVTIAADQHVAVRDWRAEALFDAAAALVPARMLCDGKQIAAFGEADFFVLDFGAPLTVYANGLETPTGRTEVGVVEIASEA